MKNTTLGRIIVTFLCIAVIAGTWDAWWHGAMGRDTFWEPPHILLYSSALVAISLGIYGWHKTKEKIWKRLAMALLLVPVSAPLDELWHSFFGVEDLSSPLIVWSPPHLAIVLAIVVSMFLMLPVLRKDTKEAQTLFGSAIFASILSLFMFILSPLQPEGPWHLLGFYGVGLIATVLVGMFILAHRWIPQLGGALFTAVFFLTLRALGMNERFAPGVSILPHAHSPSFLIVFSVLLLALSIELFYRHSRLFSSILAAFLWSALIYGFSWIFFEPAFVYTLNQGIKAVVASVIGAVIISKFDFLVYFGVDHSK